MKPVFNIPIKISLVLLVSAFILLVSGCELFEDENSRCDATKADEFVLVLKPNINIKYANGDAYGNYELKFEIYKSYCSGEINGNFSNTTETSPKGRASFNEQYKYKFANTEDKLYFTYTVIQGGTGFLVFPQAYFKYTTTQEGRLIHTVKGEISYKQASQAMTISDGKKIIEMWNDYFHGPIVLPWNLKEVYFD